VLVGGHQSITAKDSSATDHGLPPLARNIGQLAPNSSLRVELMEPWSAKAETLVRGNFSVNVSDMQAAAALGLLGLGAALATCSSSSTRAVSSR
jgi:hypothetical protein